MGSPKDRKIPSSEGRGDIQLTWTEWPFASSTDSWRPPRSSADPWSKSTDPWCHRKSTCNFSRLPKPNRQQPTVGRGCPRNMHGRLPTIVYAVGIGQHLPTEVHAGENRMQRGKIIRSTKLLYRTARYSLKTETICLGGEPQRQDPRGSKVPTAWKGSRKRASSILADPRRGSSSGGGGGAGTLLSP